MNGPHLLRVQVNQTHACKIGDAAKEIPFVDFTFANRITRHPLQF